MKEEQKKKNKKEEREEEGRRRGWVFIRIKNGTVGKNGKER